MGESQMPRGLQRIQAKATFCRKSTLSALRFSLSYRVVTSDDELSTSLDP
jgi:hypothetical protein